MTSINSSQPLRVYGYHGTNQKSAQEIIEHGFDFSTNDYDWLGTGVYFFQDAPVRAWAWAKTRYPDCLTQVPLSLTRYRFCDFLLKGHFGMT